MCTATSALTIPVLVLTLLFSFHTTETLVLCPFPQDIRGDTTPQERGRVSAEKRAISGSFPFLLRRFDSLFPDSNHKAPYMAISHAV